LALALLVLLPLELVHGFHAWAVVLLVLALTMCVEVLVRILATVMSLVPERPLPSLPDAALPTYTVLVALYRETEVAAQLVTAMAALDYPAAKLEVIYLVEADDTATWRALVAQALPPHHRIVKVPDGAPRTKPRALDYGLRYARGELVTIFDAEDHPEPLQLRRAAEAFRRNGEDLVCIQARLLFYGGHRNLLTRWFTTEYATWFSLYLPGLILDDATVPLGGTSNHFRISALLDVGGWDPWNVTEDCDLGVRLQRKGLKIGVLDSVTMEEPNTDILNWVKQRSRWYKGYLQTFLVAFRDPRSLVADLGWRRLYHFVMFVGCTPLLAVMNLWFWGLALVWLATHAAFVQAMYPGWAYYVAAAVWLLGNLSVVYVSVVTARIIRRPDLLVAALLSPLYWILMSIAALRAMVQLVTDPSHWEKTTHGLTMHAEAEPVAS
jgi:cellulose synthase/poly-beta-1,6-N-acetylglucosamine synthase-like glycosyltransferase